MDVKMALVLVLLYGVCMSMAVTQPFSPIFNPFTNEKFFAASSNNTPAACNKTTACAQKGVACSGNYGDVPSNCSSNATGTASCCAANLFCISGKCATDNMGGPCQSNNDCHMKDFSGQGYACVSNICTYLGYPGDKCANGSECGNSVPCNNSVCVGQSIGADCSKGQICGFGLGCNGTVCTQLGQNGTQCTYSSQCYPGNICSKGICVPMFSIASGQYCSQTDKNIGCQTGLTCAANSTCLPVVDSYTTCTNTSDCGSGQTCKCSEYTGKSYCTQLNVDPCTTQRQSLYECVFQYNCSRPGDSPNSCSYINCYSKFKKYFACPCSITTTVGGNCVYNPYCGGFPVWAIIIIIIVIIVVILAIVLAVFFLLRRRRQYDSI